MTVKIKKTYMKKFLALAVLGGALALTQANAYQAQFGGFKAGVGGAYTVNPAGSFEDVLASYTLGKSTDGTWFGSFCLEKDVHTSTGTMYNVAFSNQTDNDPVDTISKGTAYLYEQFALGTLTGTGVTYGTTAFASSLQDMIWYLENEVATLGSGSAFSSVLEGQFGTEWSTAATADYAGGDVKVMNVTGANGVKAQDMLVYVTVQIPDGGMTVAMLGLGLLGLAAVRRKF
jgi:hypothetical protein